MASNVENVSTWWRHHVIAMRILHVGIATLRFKATRMSQYQLPGDTLTDKD